MEKCKNVGCENKRQEDRTECKKCELKRKYKERQKRDAKRDMAYRERNAFNKPIDMEVKKRLSKFFDPKNMITYAVGMR